MANWYLNKSDASIRITYVRDSEFECGSVPSSTDLEEILQYCQEEGAAGDFVYLDGLCIGKLYEQQAA